MSFQDDRGGFRSGGPRGDFGNRPRPPMHRAGDDDGCQGGWKCAKCGNEIAELPFAPDPSRLTQLLCRDCHRSRVQSFRG